MKTLTPPLYLVIPPTVQEVIEDKGLVSTSTANGLLDQLKIRGYLKRQECTPRLLQVMERA